MWSRREVLAALGASGATVALGGWLGACAGAEQARRKEDRALALEDVLPQVLEIVDARLAGAYVWSRQSQRLRASKDSEEQRCDLEVSEDVVFGGEGHSLAIRNVSPQALLTRAQRFVATLPRAATPRRTHISALQIPAPKSPGVKGKNDWSDKRYRIFPESVSELYTKSQREADSRIIYRSSYLLEDEVDSRYLSRDHNQRHHEERKRVGVLFAVWTGDDVISSIAERATSGDIDFAGPSQKELSRSAENALAHVHARSAPSGLQDVILSSECAALVAMRAIAMPGLRLGPRAAPSGPLRVHNDPALPHGYGNYLHDARGDTPMALDFFGAQTLEQMQHGNMRRDRQLGLRALPANVVVKPGQASEQDLIADVTEGVYLDAPLHASVDPLGQSLALLCGRGREIRNGRFTGRLFSRLLASAECEPFFAETRALGKTQQALAFEESGVAMSAHSPAWLSRARVEAG